MIWKNFIYKIDSSETVTKIITILIFFDSLSMFLCKRYETQNAALSKFYFSIAITCAMVVLVVLVLKTVLATRFGELKLYFKRENGILFDWKTKLRNVSLRVKTLSHIIKDYYKNIATIKSEDIANRSLFQTGFNVGESFYEDIISFYQTQKKNFDKLSIEKKLSMWTNYDSSSGMGIFTILGFSSIPNLKFKVRVYNSFLLDTEGHSCKFLEGYITGFCSKLVNCKMYIKEIECGNRNANRECIFELTSK